MLLFILSWLELFTPDKRGLTVILYPLVLTVCSLLLWAWTWIGSWALLGALEEHILVRVQQELSQDGDKRLC